MSEQHVTCETAIKKLFTMPLSEFESIFPSSSSSKWLISALLSPHWKLFSLKLLRVTEKCFFHSAVNPIKSFQLSSSPSGLEKFSKTFSLPFLSSRNPPCRNLIFLWLTVLLGFFLLFFPSLRPLASVKLPSYRLWLQSNPFEKLTLPIPYR